MNLFKKNLLIFLLALILNLIWEFSHHHLYIDTSAIQGSPHLLIASIFDALFILGIFALISLHHHNTNWILKPHIADYSIFLSTAIAIAIFIEIANLQLGRWSYTSAMPTVFGIGLSPLVQLATTGIITLTIFKKTSA